MKLIGLDVSRGSVTVCPLEKLPRDFKRYRKGIEKIELSKVGLEKLINMQPDGVVLEPTGGHYSKLWAVRLAESKITVRWVDHGAVDAYRRAHRCPNKSDLHDAVALACYGLEHWDKEGYFILPSRLELKDYCLQYRHLGHSLTGIKNRLRQQLSHEWPEASRLNFSRNFNEKTPLILRHIAQTKNSERWISKEADSIGTGVSFFSKMLAQQICLLEENRKQIEGRILQELERNEYSPYIRAMERLGITAPKLSASLICAAYPFERFLKDGKVISEYTQTANGKRSRRNRSKSSFKLACGLGLVRYQSGDKQGFRPGGSSDARMAIYLWVRMVIVIDAGRKNREPASDFISEMQGYYRQTKGPGNLKVQKVARRLVDRLFRELVREFSPDRDRPLEG